MEILCGPLLRHTGPTTAVIWLETDEHAEITVDLWPLVGSHPVPISVSRFPVRIGESYFVWVPCRFLLPGLWYRYEIRARGEDGASTVLWPRSNWPLPSLFRTLPGHPAERLRLAFGSCRGGFPKDDPRAWREGVDALDSYAALLERHLPSPEAHWPHVLLLMGDQIYSDELSDALARRFRPDSDRLVPRAKNPTATTFSQYRAIYHEAWTSNDRVRWLLSCVPSFMIFDDHDVIDDWNISEDWRVERLRSPGWRRLLTSGLLSYWIYQGAGNLDPRQWGTDPRMRPLVPSWGNAELDLLPRLERLFSDYTTRRRRARWGFTVPVRGTSVVACDTRMSRRLTGSRLITNDTAWTEFVGEVKGQSARRVVVIAPGPVLAPRALHIILSRAAESIEGDPPSAVGALVGAGLGFLVAGPPGAVVGALGGAVGGEVLLDHFMPQIIEHADAELWAAFPTSFNRMLSLLEDLHDGVGTRRKAFVSILAGDVHHSHVIKGDLLRTNRPGSVWHFTVSPFRRQVGSDDRELLESLDSGRLPYRSDVLLGLEKPGFVDDQFDRLSWYPLSPSGRPSSYVDVDEWDFFGKMVGLMELSLDEVTYEYLMAPEGDVRGTLRRHASGAVPI
jgi:hypothetical protein